MQFRHTANINQQVDALTQAFRIAADQFVDTVTVYRFLAGEPCRNPREYFRRVLGISDSNGNGDGNGHHGGIHGTLKVVADAGNEREQGKRQLGRLIELFETQPGAEYCRARTGRRITP